jgi:peptide/nickel transport system permease protein
VTLYALQRLLAMLPVLLGVSVLVFGVLALVPGDPALAILGPYATPEALAELRAELGLDRSLPVQYAHWLGNVLSGDLGHSVSLDRPVLDEVAERLGPTLLLAVAALLVSVPVGLAAGVAAATHHNAWQDRALTLAVLVGLATPTFWLALLLIMVFAAWLGWLPVSGMWSIWGGGGPGDLLAHLVLPCIALAAVAGAVIARITRTQMLEVLRQDYVRLARSKGLSERRVVYRHAFRNAVVAVVPVIGLQTGFLIGGAVYVESIFQWPGLGRALVDAIAARDLLLVQGAVLVLAGGYVLINLLADLAQYTLDPRIRRGGRP